MQKFKRRKSMLTPKDKASYLVYKLADFIGICVGLGLCAAGNNMASAPVNEAGEYVKSMSTQGTIMMIVGLVIVVFFGVLLYNLVRAKDEMEEDLIEKERIRAVIVETQLDDVDDTETEESEDEEVESIEDEENAETDE